MLMIDIKKKQAIKYGMFFMVNIKSAHRNYNLATIFFIVIFYQVSVVLLTTVK